MNELFCHFYYLSINTGQLGVLLWLFCRYCYPHRLPSVEAMMIICAGCLNCAGLIKTLLALDTLSACLHTDIPGNPFLAPLTQPKSPFAHFANQFLILFWGAVAVAYAPVCLRWLRRKRSTAIRP